MARAGWFRDSSGRERGGAPQRVPVPRYPEAQDAACLRAAADAAFVAGDSANAHSNRFVAASVLLSTVLFLSGISQLLKRTVPRAAVLGLSAFLLVGVLCWLVQLPTAAV